MRQIALVLATFVFSSAAFAVDQQLLNLVMPDAKVLAGANVTKVRSSPLGQFLIARIGSFGQSSQDAIALTGFDPLQDVFEVLAATSADPAQRSGLILVSGNFKVDQIVAAVTGRANASVQTYGTATLITGPGSKSGITGAVAFLRGGNIAIAGDLASVKAAIDRTSKPSVLDPSLALKVSDISLNQDEWLVSSVPVANLIPPDAKAPTGLAAQVLPILKSVQSFSGGVKFGSDVQFTGQAVTNDPANAGALTAVIRLAVALASGNAANDPHLAQILRLLQPLQVNTSQNAVNVSLSIPESQIEALANSVPVRVVPSTAPRRRAPTQRR